MTAPEMKPVAGPAGYKKSTTIYGCKDSVNALSISGDGKYLVSGGDEGLLRVFSLGTDYKEICRFQNQSPVLSVAWLNRYSFTFLMGDWSGDVFTIRVKLPNTPLREPTSNHIATYYGGRVYCVSIHDAKCLVAVAHGDKVSISKRTAPMPSTSVSHALPSPGIPPELGLSNAKLAHEIPFSMNFNSDGAVLAVTYYQHGTVGWDVDTRQKLWHIAPHTLYLGYSAISPDRKLLCRTNVFNGVDWIVLMHNQRDAEMVSVTEHECQANYIVPVLFTFKGEHIVIGGDRGCATIWRVKDRKTIQTLRHGSPGDMVQALAYHRYHKKAVIVSATANMGADTTITIWTSTNQSLSIGDWFSRWAQYSSYSSTNTITAVIGALSMAIIAVVVTLLLTGQIILPNVSKWPSSVSSSLPRFDFVEWRAPFVRTLTETSTHTITATQPTTFPTPSTPALTPTTPFLRSRNNLSPTIATASYKN